VQMHVQATDVDTRCIVRSCEQLGSLSDTCTARCNRCDGIAAGTRIHTGSVSGGKSTQDSLPVVLCTPSLCQVCASAVVLAGREPAVICNVTACDPDSSQ
jgi:hypothetical protein